MNVVNNRPTNAVAKQYYDIVVGLQKSIVHELKNKGYSEIYIQNRFVDKLQLMIEFSGKLGRFVELEDSHKKIMKLKNENFELKQRLSKYEGEIVKYD